MTWRARRLAGAVLMAGALALSGCLSGCASVWRPPQTAALEADPAAVQRAGLPEQVELTALPFFPLTDAAQARHCGPQALATVLQPLGLPADLPTLTQAVYLPERGGSLQIEMLAAARRSGALAVQLPGRLDALLLELAAGHPVVVLQNLGLNWGESLARRLGITALARWHYAVVVGYDRERHELILRSGNEARQVLPWSTFEYTWARGGHWAMAVLPPDELPLTGTQASAIDAALGLERVAPPATAVTAWRTVLARWPLNLTAAIGLGNSLYANGQIDEAARAWSDAARRHDSAVAWNNLAQLELARARWPAARAALTRALQRAQAAEPQWLAAVQQTAQELDRAQAAAPAR